MFIYPDNLKAKATLWLWQLRDVAIIGVAFLLSVLALAQTGTMLPLVGTVLYAFRLTGIDPIDLSASKTHLIALRFKASLPKLLCHRPDRPVHHTFHTWHDIRVPRTAVDYGIAVIYDTLIHTFRRKLFLLLLCNLSPFQTFPFYPAGIFFQCFMENISKIKSSKFIYLSLLKAKSIGQKMLTGTGRKLLQS